MVYEYVYNNNNNTNNTTNINIQNLNSFIPPSNTFYPVYSLDLSRQYINDSLLQMILQRYGSRLYVLKINHTFITASGLLALSMCPNLRVLSLVSCHLLTDKQNANHNLMGIIRQMRELSELNISDSHLSGRLLSAHPALSLYSFHAHACPLSTKALRLLSETCDHTLSILSLAGCAYINRTSLHYIIKFIKLSVLDLSYCQGLDENDLSVLLQWPPANIRELMTVTVRGINGMNESACSWLQQQLTEIKRSNGPMTQALAGAQARTQEEVARYAAAVAVIGGVSGDSKVVVSRTTRPVDQTYQIITPPITSRRSSNIFLPTVSAGDIQLTARYNEVSAEGFSASGEEYTGEEDIEGNEGAAADEAGQIYTTVDDANFIHSKLKSSPSTSSPIVRSSPLTSSSYLNAQARQQPLQLPITNARPASPRLSPRLSPQSASSPSALHSALSSLQVAGIPSPSLHSPSTSTRPLLPSNVVSSSYRINDPRVTSASTRLSPSPTPSPLNALSSSSSAQLLSPDAATLWTPYAPPASAIVNSMLVAAYTPVGDENDENPNQHSKMTVDRVNPYQPIGEPID